MGQGDTISAIATAVGDAGIGIIRISGAQAREVLLKMFRPQGKRTEITKADDRRVIYGDVLRADGTFVDEAIVLYMKAPHSYTKEDVVEIQCHGGSAALREVLSLTYTHGARAAEPGEFTKRAFLNGRLDLSEAEAVMDVVKARTPAALAVAEGKLRGRLSSKIKAIREDMLALEAHLEALIDFPEEGVEDISLQDAGAQAKAMRERIEALLKTASVGRALREGLKVTIVGRPNVGKSSLLNALLGEERAIVTNVPGTTRDVIEETIDVGGVPLSFVDTAGIRETGDAIERMGVEKSKEAVRKAALVLALFDGSRPLNEEDKEILRLVTAENKDTLPVVTKKDLTCVLDTGILEINLHRKPVAISTRTEAGIQPLFDAIQTHVMRDMPRLEEGAMVDDARTEDALRKAAQHLAAMEQTIQANLGADFLTIDLRAAYEKLGEITGETAGEDILEAIFSRFCIGK